MLHDNCLKLILKKCRRTNNIINNVWQVKDTMLKEDLTNYLKNFGFLISNAKIYGGLAKAWDLGPYGIELKRNLKSLWWKYFITTNPYNVGCDSLIITHPKILAASGHQKKFCDWLVDCLNCRKRYRIDNLLDPIDLTNLLISNQLENYQVKNKCPNCQKASFTSPSKFNLLLSTNLEIIKNKERLVYLRPETCQGIFTNFLAIQRSTHKKIPFGVGQIGKSFRNEITLQHGIFRTREFEQMELEFFCLPTEKKKWWDYWVEKAWIFFQKVIINNPTNIQKKELNSVELPHYAQKTTDFYFHYHFGWGEVCSNSQRGNYDLFQHSQLSGQTLNVNNIIPEVIEVSFGVERLMLAILEDAYQLEKIKNAYNEDSERKVLKIAPILAPYFVAVIPLEKSLREKSYQLYCELLKNATFSVAYEETGNIGNRYRRQDAIGTYYCLTVDKLTVNEYLPNGEINPDYNTATLRYRDTMEQEKKRISVNNLKIYLNNQYKRFWQEFFLPKNHPENT